MQRYATYRARVLAQLAMATGLDVGRLPPDALAALPDLYRAGLGIDDAADRITAPGLQRKPARPPHEDPDDQPANPQEEK